MARASAGTSISTNVTLMVQIVESLLDAMLVGTRLFSASMSAVLAAVHRRVEEQWPGTGINACGTLVFLRFVCPAIVNLFRLFPLSGKLRSKEQDERK